MAHLDDTPEWFKHFVTDTFKPFLDRISDNMDMG